MLKKKLITILMVFALGWTTVSCGSPSPTAVQQPVRTAAPAPTQLSDGKYPVQQAEYDDATGEYTLMLLNARPPVYRTDNLQMARLTAEQIQAGESSYLAVENNQPILYLTEDFKIEYVHNVTETQTNPQTGQTETVIVRRESNFWSPFAGAFVGSAIANSLFAPRYYVPPVYQPGGVMVGYGGYGNTYNQAVSQYRRTYNEPPPAVKNRQTFRSTGTVRSSSPSSSTSPNRTNPNANRSTGSGVGGSNLRQSQEARPTQRRTPSFGTGSGSRHRSTGGSRRRR
ncbi:hypothetical protein [Lyngbya sp. CCY1209]|uniref:hypothetical protein n=1 Tax=Lyngbya sp. CCY1209 TaxID=2886103 RepID=UPI002D1FF2C1|nr:hypothetical protein [Lyngbya sp. CCY1209]MEB3885008.1 hypothetical protein [Lyngbya sp. CCY1209]